MQKTVELHLRLHYMKIEAVSDYSGEARLMANLRTNGRQLTADALR